MKRLLWLLAACGTTAPAKDFTIGTWTDLTGNPDLGALTSPMQQPVDFGMWQARDGSWHIWECIRYTLLDGRTRLFYRWSAPAPTGPWTADGIAMQADPSVGETEGGLQAPYVFSDGTQYRMYYGTWDNLCQQTSADGVTFTRVLDANGQCPLFSEVGVINPRDPMVLHDGNTWRMYYTAIDGDGVAGRVYARTSSDLASWSDAIVVSSGPTATSTECPFVVHRESGYYLFRTRQYGEDAATDVFRSRDPMRFDDSTFMTTLPVAAPELIEADGRLYIAALKPGLDGIRLAPLTFP